MNKKIAFWMLGFATMLASCSQDEVLQSNDKQSTVTITAQLDNGIKTRASYAEDDEVQRCILEVQEVNGEEKGEIYEGVAGADNTYTFNLTLKDGQKYDFLFWADDNASYDTESGLASIAVKEGKPGIAYFGSILNSELSAGMSVSLTCCGQSNIENDRYIGNWEKCIRKNPDAQRFQCKER